VPSTRQSVLLQGRSQQEGGIQDTRGCPISLRGLGGLPTTPLHLRFPSQQGLALLRCLCLVGPKQCPSMLSQQGSRQACGRLRAHQQGQMALVALTAKVGP
jgi:hypothetical protein